MYLEATQRYENCISEKVARISDFRPRTDVYEARLVDIESFAWEYKRVEETAGVSVEKLPEADSEFTKTLARLDPQKDYIAFIVRPDSFPTYRKARELAWKKGFNVGWEPQPTGRSLIFGTSGRSIGVQ